MTQPDTYHRERERQCRDMAEQSSDVSIRKIHEQLAALHAREAEVVNGAPSD